MKYAIISDIHGNLTALNSILEDIKTRKIDRIVCLGDTISKGCHSHECLELVRKNADAVLVGNNDLIYVKGLDELVSETHDFNFESFYFNQKQLIQSDINYLKSLPMCCEFELSGCLVRCYHASPDDIDKTIITYDNLNEKMKQFEPTKYTSNKQADIVVFGHSHDPHMECLFGRRMINAGSVGNPVSFISDDKYNSKAVHLNTMAQYVVLDGEDGDKKGNISIEFVMVPYDIDKELEDFKFTLEKDLYTKELKEAKYRYPERIAKKLSKLGVIVK